MPLLMRELGLVLDAKKEPDGRGASSSRGESNSSPILLPRLMRDLPRLPAIFPVLVNTPGLAPELIRDINWISRDKDKSHLDHLLPSQVIGGQIATFQHRCKIIGVNGAADLIQKCQDICFAQFSAFLLVESIEYDSDSTHLIVRQRCHAPLNGFVDLLMSLLTTIKLAII